MLAAGRRTIEQSVAHRVDRAGGDSLQLQLGLRVPAHDQAAKRAEEEECRFCDAAGGNRKSGLRVERVRDRA